MFQRHPLHDPSGALEHNDTVYILFDWPCRVFLDTEHKSRVFGNIWLLNGSLIFRGLCHDSRFRRFLSDVFPDSSGVLEGEQVVRGSSTRYNLRYCEQPVVYNDSESRSRLNHSYLRPIITTPSANPSSVGAFEDWTVLSHPTLHSINVHIYDSRGSPGSTSSLVCFHASNYSDIARKLLHRTYLHRLQHPSDQDIPCYTRLSIHSTMRYSWAYSTTIDCMTNIPGMSDWGGASSLVFVKDGVASYTPRHSTLVCIFDAPMAPL